MNTRHTIIAALAALASFAAYAEPSDKAEEQKEKLKTASDLALTSAVVVDLTPQLVGVEEPLVMVMAEKCPNCGNYHSSGVQEFIGAERSMFVAGFLVEPDAVLCVDIGLKPENIGKIKVLRGDTSVAAKLEKVFVDQGAMLLRLEAPLEGVSPVAVDPAAGKPDKSVVIAQSKWGAGPSDLVAIAKPAAGEACRLQDGTTRYLSEDPVMLLFDKEMRVCGFNFNSRTTDEETYDPAKWKALTVAELEVASKDAVDAAARSILPVTLTFRSQKASRSGSGRSWMYSDDDENLSELVTFGFMVKDSEIAVFIGENRKQLTRLDKIKVYFPDGKMEEAEFNFVHKRVNLMVAKLPGAHPEATLKITEEDFRGQTQKIQMLVDVSPAGDGKTKIRSNRVRLLAREFGWRNTPAVAVPARDTPGSVIFNMDGEALWNVAQVRDAQDSLGEEERWRSYSEEIYVPSSVFVAFAEAGEADIDAAAKPVPETDDGAIGWVGLDLQALDPALAEAMGVMSETGNGSYGAIVQHVHPGSAAEKAGVQPDWILVSMQAEGDVVPRKVKISDAMDMFRGRFPWDELDNITSEVSEYIPAPWPAVKNDFTSSLMRIGVGSKVQVEFIGGNEKISKELVIEKGPTYFENAKEYEWKNAGISVCDLTFEVREYLNLAQGAPGVVVCKMETSGKAITAGVKKFEVVTAVNGTAVHNVGEFEEAVKNATDFKLDVLRMNSSRVVQFSAAGNADAEPVVD